jgi:hypothetical protein
VSRHRRRPCRKPAPLAVPVEVPARGACSGCQRPGRRIELAGHAAVLCSDCEYVAQTALAAAGAATDGGAWCP